MFFPVGLVDFLSSFLYFVFTISVIVFVHEYGHYIVAKMFKVKIEIFSIGCGPELIGVNDKSGTRWRFSLIPIGGYVKMFGDANIASSLRKDMDNNLSADDIKSSFHEKKIYQKFLIILAGPLFNLIFAFLVFAFLFNAGKIYRPLPIIGEVIEGSAAESSGMKSGDIILAINGKTISYFEDIIYFLRSNPSKLVIDYSNGKELRTVVVFPKDMTKVDSANPELQYYLGITPSYDKKYLHMNLATSFRESGIYIYVFIRETLSSLWQMLTTSKGMQELGGPIRIAKYSGRYAKEGLLLRFMALISINLGVLNLLPIPLLDGGHLFHYIIQMILRKKELSEKYLKYTSMIGMIILFSLIAFATFNDVKYIFR